MFEKRFKRLAAPILDTPDNGDIYEELDTDFLFESELFIDIDKLPKKKIYGHAYNQKEPDSHRSTCTMYSAITVVSNLMNYKFSDAEIEEIVQMAE